ncbi:MAG TPA: Ig-like domain-containing protein [Tepidisphaeraceae bacterium]|nr:Ig-like domain-containing protein [Tepidisphaeraceae bacterium]
MRQSTARKGSPVSAGAAECRCTSRLRTRPASPGVEALEPRVLFAGSRMIGGHVVADVIVASKHPHHVRHAIARIHIFLDLNGNGIADANEPVAITDKQGHFIFRKLTPGTYSLIELAPPGYVPETPASGAIAVNTQRHSVLGVLFVDMPGTSSVGRRTGPDVSPPSAALDVASLSSAGPDPYRFSVTWSDATGVDISGFRDGNVIVAGPNGYRQPGNLVALDATGNGSPRTTTYQVLAPAGGWAATDDGVYTITLQGGQVRDTLGNADPAIGLGSFIVAINPAVPAAPLLLNAAAGDVTGNDNSSSASAIAVRIDDTTPGSQLALLADGAQIGAANASSDTTLVSADGHTALTSGQHVLAVRETLPGGVVVTSAPTGIIVDTTAPDASLNAQPIITAGAAGYSFSITYSDDTNVSVASLGGGGLLVTGSNGFSQTPSLIALDANMDGPTRTATYRISAPGGAWTSADNGNFTVSLLDGRVRDGVGNTIAGGVVGTFAVSIGMPLSLAPGLPNLMPASDTGVSSSDNLTSLNNSSPGTELQVLVPGTTAGASVTLFSDGTPIGSATAAGDSTVVSTDGVVALADGAHQITARQTIAGQGQSPDSQAMGIVIDDQPPTAASQPANVNGSGAASYSFLVVYRDNFSLDISKFDSQDIVVAGPTGVATPATFVSVNSPYNGMPRTVTYAITPPGGAWTPADNGTYTIALQAGQVFDTAGNPAAPATLATFVVNAGVLASAVPAAPALLPGSDTGSSSTDGITNLNNSSAGAALQFSVGGTAAGATVTVYADGNPIGAALANGGTTTVVTNGLVPLADGPHTFTARQTQVGQGASSDSPSVTITIDTSPPAANALQAANIAAAGASSYQFTVTYADNIAVDPASFDNSDIVVTSPGGVSIVAALVSASGGAPAGSLSATYQIAPPDGAWSFADNGTYAIALQAGQIADSAGNHNAAQSLGSFVVNIPQPISPPTAAPVLAAASDTGASNADGITNLNNASPASELQFSVGGVAAGATVTLYADGTPLTATVATSAAAILTTRGDLPLAQGVHTFTARQQMPGALQSPDSSAASVTIDLTPPVATLQAAPLTVGGSAPYGFSVVWSDDVALDPSSLGNGNFIVTGPNGFSAPATFIAVDNNSPGTPRAASYQIAPPAGGWTAAADGAYTVSLQPGRVLDTAGNAAAAGAIGTFQISI